MLLGDRNDLDQTIADGFSQAGILHLLCVSGFHISLITSAFLWVIQKPVSYTHLDVYKRQEPVNHPHH